ncbi:hypothetical protein HF325_003199 [Metschnikowia pulcherrima]|uniref:asparaginase n=1 Tax=Metschnikowia pulcherrima TaxID=27326 RepID=A0A8H7LBG0_9ASCO|nr:hypothetical protein HF325_003199 [Metschnikowia pulcherrima]
MSAPGTIDESIDIQEDRSDIFHPVYTVRYRQNSIGTIDSVSSVGSQKLPVIKILGTGGTIAAKGALAIPQPGYHVDLTIEDLIASVPDLSHTCRGVLVTLNDKIGSGYYISKTDANSLDTFKSLGHGYLGNFVAGEAHYYFPALKPSGLKNFQLPPLFSGSLPEVAIFYAHQNFNNDLIKLAVKHMHLKGIVMATMGAGSLSDLTNEVLGEISSENHLPVIYSKRSTDGMIPISGLPKSDNHFLVASGYLNPPKARILLQLCLFEQMDIKQIRKVFAGVYGG